MGRNGKLTPELQAKIVDAIAAGNFNVVAAQSVGICQTTFYRWLDEGKAARTGIKKDFREAINKAEAEAEAGRVQIIIAAGEETWQAAAWWLERKHYERWGRKERKELTGEGGGPVGVTFTDLLKEVAQEHDGNRD